MAVSRWDNWWTDEQGVRHNGTICWTCARAVNKCRWSLFFEPIPGWTAEPTTLSEYKKEGILTYTVIRCPLYIWDGNQDKE